MPNVFSEAHDVTLPSGDRDRSLGDDDIRQMKREYDQRLDVDHVKPQDESGEAYVGFHRQVTLVAAKYTGSALAGTGILKSKDVGLGAIELAYIDESANETVLTKRGKIKLSAGKLENNTWLIGSNAAGNADVNMIKVNASDLIEIPAGAVLSTSAAPTSDAAVANKKYVDDTVTAAGAVSIGTDQTITGQKTFSAQIIASAGIKGAVNLNGGNISNGNMSRTSTGSVGASNNTDMYAPSGAYVIGYHRDSDGSAGTLFYAYL